MDFQLDLTEWLEDKTVCPLCGSETENVIEPQTKYECGSIVEIFGDEVSMNTLTKKCFIAFLTVLKNAK